MSVVLCIIDERVPDSLSHDTNKGTVGLLVLPTDAVLYNLLELGLPNILYTELINSIIS